MSSVTRRRHRPAELYLSSLAPGSQPAMRSALRRWARLLSGNATADPDAVAWHRLEVDCVLHAAQVIRRSGAPGTANRHYAALRGVLRHAWLVGLISDETRARLGYLSRVRGRADLAGRRLQEGELEALIEACDDQTPLGVRDAAAILLAYGCGLRRQELATVGLVNLTLAGPAQRVQVDGKGGSKRSVPLPSTVAAVARQWIAVRSAIGIPSDVPFVVAASPQGRLLERGLSGNGFRSLLHRRAELAGIVEPLTPHDLRRSYASDCLDRGMDPLQLQRHLGHRQLGTTQRYDRRGDQAARAIVDTLGPQNVHLSTTPALPRAQEVA